MPLASPSRLAAIGAACALLLVSAAAPVGASEALSATTLHDVSGLAPLGPGQAVAVHDAKHPDEDDRPRASLLTLPTDPTGVLWQPLQIEWLDPTTPSNDLESASSIPGSSQVLFAESGDDGSDFQRLFLAEVDTAAADGPTATIVAETGWPEPIYNVEGIAVGEAGGELVLLWAERAQGDPMTMIQFAPLTLEPFAIGEAASVEFTSPAMLGEDDRPVSALEIDSDGIIHVAAAYDSGNDAGPFSSSVWAIGLLFEGADGPSVELMPEPAIVAFADGYKIESLAILEDGDGAGTLWFGTDDEDFGGTIRPLPAQ
jgi:hypothetical protein